MTDKKLAKRTSAAAMRRFYQEAQDDPVGRLLLEDLAASREHGGESVRVGIAPDGAAVVYAADEDVGKRVGESLRNTGHVRVRQIPKLTMEQFELLAAQSQLASEDDKEPQK